MGVLSEEERRTVKDIGIIGSMLIQNQKIETVVAGRLLMPNKSGDSEGRGPQLLWEHIVLL